MGTEGGFCFYASFGILGFILIFLLLPETKGVSLDKMDELLSQGWIRGRKAPGIHRQEPVGSWTKLDQSVCGQGPELHSLFRTEPDQYQENVSRSLKGARVE